MFEDSRQDDSNPEELQGSDPGWQDPALETALYHLRTAPAGTGLIEAFTSVISLTTTGGLNKSELAHRLEASEKAKAAIAALQAWDAMALDEANRGHGTGTEVALARREAPIEGSKHLASARILIEDMPQTMSRFTLGALTEAQAMLIAHETRNLDPDTRRVIDASLNEHPEEFDGEGLKALGNRVRAKVMEHDPTDALAKVARARAGRYVALYPAPDAMMHITGMVPVEQGLLLNDALNALADTTTATGKAQGRTRDQLRTDALFELLAGTPTPEVQVNLVMSVQSLFQGDTEAAHLQGYGTVPASWARLLFHGQGKHEKARRYIRRLFTAPGTGELLAMESRQRLFPAGLSHLIRIRDQICTTPGCGNRIRHNDHTDPWANGGKTTAENGRAACVLCNLTKEQPGWLARVVPGRRHTVEITTPAGKVYRSMSPPLPGTSIA